MAVRVVFSGNDRPAELDDEVVALAAAFQSSMMDASELLHLAAVLSLQAWRGDHIAVEIGAFQGRTTVFMARVLERLGHAVPILSIDPFERAVPDALNPQGDYAAYMQNVLSHGYGHRCMPLTAFSQDAAAVVPARIGVLVIDGAHHYEAVSADLALYMPKLAPGAYAFIDDYGPSYPDVIRAVDEHLAAHPEIQVVHRGYFVVARRPAGTGER